MNIFFSTIAVIGLFTINSIIESPKYKSKLGSKIIINKDTLQIIDYSILNENFVLNNGVTINYLYCIKQIKVK